MWIREAHKNIRIRIRNTCLRKYLYLKQRKLSFHEIFLRCWVGLFKEIFAFETKKAPSYEVFVRCCVGLFEENLHLKQRKPFSRIFLFCVCRPDWWIICIWKQDNSLSRSFVTFLRCRLAAYQRTNRSTPSGKKEETFNQCVFYGSSF